jgi:hypothetical protein
MLYLIEINTFCHFIKDTEPILGTLRYTYTDWSCNCSFGITGLHAGHRRTDDWYI